ncbi:response regulator [Mucilaginibacter agri]|uniref:Response regulator n=1 Tax=Mucilaginibacter agri TaxID=2695265 RepID=A0A966DQT2_9SPHI|nr:response regulator [Mucilaginibacter agri]NCD68318.1 response regulator [Mucilaginibacter agri]
MNNSESRNRRQRILIIDDQQDVLDLMTELLEPQEYQVTTLNQVQDIFTEIDNSQPDIILMDFILSGINGGEFCAQIKKNVHTKHIPVIFLSAHSRVIESPGNYGYDDFIAKPFDVDDVLATIKKYLPARST